MTSILEAKGITRIYGKKHAVDNVSLNLTDGSVHALIGESGSGKTTLARILGGIEKQFSGQLHVSRDKRVVLVQQDFVIWPELSVAENISIGCPSKADRKQWLPRIMDLIELSDKKSFKAGQLSYGQQQRVAIARALAARPDVIILDEPFAHLDIWLRQTMWNRCLEIFKEMEITSLWITHNVQDALPVADTVMVMTKGKLEQTGSPQTIYGQPKSHSIAKLTGPYSYFSEVEWKQLGFSSENIFAAGVKCIGCRPKQLKLVEDPSGVLDGESLKSWFTGSLTLYKLNRSDFSSPLWMTSSTNINAAKKYRLELIGKPFVLNEND